MSIDPDDSVMEQALRSDLPSADAKERVRRRLLAAGVAVGNGMAVTTSAAATGTAATTGLVAKAMGASWGIKLGLAAAITIPSVGLLLEEPRQPAAVVQPPRPQRALEADAPLVTPPVVEPALGQPTPEAQAPKAARPVVLQAPVSEPAQPPASEPSQVEFTHPADAAPAPAKQASTLADETRLLDAAFAELAAGRRARAAALIAEHEAKFPAGLLQRERDRAKAKLSESSRGE